MKLGDLLYTYKEMGVVEKDGVKFKKYVRVPRVRSKHRAALSQALFTAVLAAAAFKGLGWLLERLKDAG
ncbi:MAG: hypothetical protein FD126_1445 [Elusimicrobia bacterium]|nr:MAG: hypothetical protein FD126_1445 [Elusimicrobiota bacterium]